MKFKFRFFFCITSAAFLFLILRVSYLKICYGKEYETKALSQQLRAEDQILPPHRGKILDRNGAVLAQSVPVYDVILEPITLDSLKSDPSYDHLVTETLSKLSEKLSIPLSQLQQYLEKDAAGQLCYPTYYLPIAKEIPASLAMEIEQLHLTGVWLEEKEKRQYPNGSLACKVVGFQRGENQWGLEQSYNPYLSGKNGRCFRQYDASLGAVDELNFPPIHGDTVLTTIDSQIQKFAEEGVSYAMELFPCETAAILVMNPTTGEIYAMADSNSFDLNAPAKPTFLTEKDWKALSAEEQSRLLNHQWMNYCITSTFEPGSIFKPLVVGAALDEGLITNDSTFYCAGFKQVADRKIHCIRRSGHFDETLEEVISNSCNCAMMEIAEKMGPQTFFHYQKDFGFGEATGIDLPNESDCSALLYEEEDLGPVELATSSFGQSFNCTPLQALNALNVIANGGNLMRPYVVKTIFDETGAIKEEIHPTSIRTVLSPSSCQQVTDYLQAVVDHGTGKKAQVEGFSIAGKSGTGQQGDRSKEQYTITFAGFAPAEDPSFSMIVVLDQPKDYADGVTTAAPIFQRVAQKILDYQKIQPQVSADSETDTFITLPDFTGQGINTARSFLNDQKISTHIAGRGTEVISQFPKAGAAIEQNATVYLYTN